MASKSGWVIEYANAAVRRDVRKLPESIREDFATVRTIIENEGIDKVPSRYIKPIKGRKYLWEFRLTGENRTAARTLYFTWERKRIVIVHALMKKSERLPQREIALAEKRMKAFKEAEGGGR